MWGVFVGSGGSGQVKTLALYDRFEPRVDMQFIQHMLDVVTGRSRADTHSGRNLRSAPSICQ